MNFIQSVMLEQSKAAKAFQPVVKIVTVARINSIGAIIQPIDVMTFEVEGVDVYQCKSKALDLACPHFGGYCTVVNVTDKPTDEELDAMDECSDCVDNLFLSHYFDEEYND